MTATGSASVPLIALGDVTKRFANGTQALGGLSLEVGAHEFVALLGPSGCGKSTALRLIAGLGTATSGTVGRPGIGSHRETGPDGAPGGAIGGETDGETSGEIGFVFQEPTLMPWANVFDNVYLPLRLAGRSRAAVRDRVEAALAMVGLSDFQRVFPRELSGGMKMRAAIARALVTGPRLLLMDEPFAALDEITRLKLNDDLLALWKAQRWTVLFVTHSVYESVYLASRIVVFSARPGRAVAEIAVDASYPRDEAYRTSSGYNATCRAVSAALKDAMSIPAEI